MRDTKGPLKLFKRCVFKFLLASGGFFIGALIWGRRLGTSGLLGRLLRMSRLVRLQGLGIKLFLPLGLLGFVV